MVPTYAPPAMLLQRARELLVPLLDSADILLAQAGAADAMERWTLLFEPMPGLLPGDVRYTTLVDSLASHLQVTRREREQQGDRETRWASLRDVDPSRPHARYRLVLEGFALRPLVSTFPGFAVASSDLQSPCVIRVHALEGDDPDALIADLDERRRAILRQRHRGEEVALPDVPDRVTFRHEPAKWVHVPTGLSLAENTATSYTGPLATSRTALLAACYRAVARESNG
jgi:hypothetical protein